MLFYKLLLFHLLKLRPKHLKHRYVLMLFYKLLLFHLEVLIWNNNIYGHCVNALLQASAFPPKIPKGRHYNMICVNALLQASAFPQYPFKNPLFMRDCEPVFAGIYLTILIISVFCYFLGFF